MRPLILLPIIVLLCLSKVHAQVKIGDNPQNIDALSLLELESSTRVLVITKMTTAQMEAIAPQAGGMVYNTDSSCVHYYTGNKWVNLCDIAGFTLTNDAIENIASTITITTTPEGYNLEVAQNSIRSENIVDGSINGNDIQNNSIGQDKLGADAVGPSEISDNAVGSEAILDGSIRPEDIANADPGQILATDVNGVVRWQDALDFQAVVVDPQTLEGTGTVDNPLGLALVVQQAIQANTQHVLDDGDLDATNEIQNAAEVEVLATGNLTGTNVQLALEELQVDVDNLNAGGANTDEQNLSTDNTPGTISIDNGNTITLNVNDADADATNEIQDAAEVAIDPITGITGNNVQLALEELQTTVEILIAGGGNTDEQDLANVLGQGNSAGTNRIINLGAPIDNTDAATKQYVDDEIAGLPGGSDDQNASEVPVTANPINYIAGSPDVEAHLAGIDAALGAAGGNLLGDVTGPTTATVIANDAVTTNKIADAAVTAEKLDAMGANTNEVLKWNGTNWAPAADAGGVNYQPGDGLSLSGGDTFNVDALLGDVTGPTTATVIANDAVTTNKIANAAVTAEKLDAMGANTNEVLKWNGTIWAPAADAIGNYLPGVGLSLNGLTFDVDNLAGDVTGPPSATVIADNAITSAKIANGAILVEDLNQNGATDGQILKWNDGAGTWEPSNESAAIMGTENSIFFANASGAPITAEQTAYPGNEQGLFWNPTSRANTGALFVGRKPSSTYNIETTPSKVVVVERLNSLAYPLQILNESNTLGAAAGILFATNFTGTASQGKGALAYERTGLQGLGDFHFLQNTAINTTNPALTQAVMTLKNNGNIIIGPNSRSIATTQKLHVEGTMRLTEHFFDESGAQGTPGQVLSSTATGTAWIDAPGGGGTIVSVEANNAIIASGVDGGAFYDDTPLLTAITLNSTAITTKEDSANKSNDGTLADNSAVDFPTEQAVKTYVDTQIAGVTGGSNMANTDLTLIAERTHDLAGFNFILEGTGNVGIGNFNGPGLPAGPADKLDVNGQVRTRGGFAANPGTVGEPSYGFYTDGDTDTGMFRSGPDEIGFSVGGEEALRMEEDGGNTNVIVFESLELNNLLLDKDGDAGIAGQILSSTGTQTDWIDAPLGGTEYTAGLGLTLNGTVFDVDNLAGEVTGPTNATVIADNAITSARIADASITADDLADSSVETGQILNETILNDDISPVAAIEGSKINPIFTAQINATAGITSGADILMNGNFVQPDYVFQRYFLGTSTINPNYNFSSLKDVEDFVKQNHHLPGVQSAQQIKAQGFWNLGEASRINLEKIEELFLHTIAQEKKLESLQAENEALSQKMKALEAQMQALMDQLNPKQ